MAPPKNDTIIYFEQGDEGAARSLRLPTKDVRIDTGGVWYRRGEGLPWTLCPWHRIRALVRS
jgi:hypothetical protein